MQAVNMIEESKLRQFALQIARQLPEDQGEAMRVIEYARELVIWVNEDNKEERD